jgi:hypothetical protein
MTAGTMATARMAYAGVRCAGRLTLPTPVGFRQVRVDREVRASMMVASAGERVQGASTSQTPRRPWAK